MSFKDNVMHKNGIRRFWHPKNPAYNRIFMISSFKRIRADIDSLKDSITEWLAFINTRQAAADSRIAELEKRVNELEKRNIEVY